MELKLAESYIDGGALMVADGVRDGLHPLTCGMETSDSESLTRLPGVRLGFSRSSAAHHSQRGRGQ